MGLRGTKYSVFQQFWTGIYFKTVQSEKVVKVCLHFSYAENVTHQLDEFSFEMQLRYIKLEKSEKNRESLFTFSVKLSISSINLTIFY